jgi:hypothetical protein
VSGVSVMPYFLQASEKGFKCSSLAKNIRKINERLNE